MAAPLDGVRVVEVATWAAMPAAGALMADMGADVIKVEPPGGNPERGFVGFNAGVAIPASMYGFQLNNRGKRSVTVDLERPSGPQLVRRMAAGADIFLTNLLPARRQRFGMSYDDIVAVSPRVVYALFSGYGDRGPLRDRPSYDWGAFWAATGIMSMYEYGGPPMLSRGMQGDYTTSLNILSAVLSGYIMRERTGEPQNVEITLQGTGIWTIGPDYATALVDRKQPPPIHRETRLNPISNYYQCSDGRWVVLINTTAFPNLWPRFCAMVDRPDWREAYTSLDGLRIDAAALTAAIEAIFREHDLAYWSAQLDAHGLIWAPVLTMPEVIDDPQVREMGWFTKLDHPRMGEFETVDTPFKLHGTDTGARGPAPEAGGQTWEVLQEFGLTEAELGDLAADGVLG